MLHVTYSAEVTVKSHSLALALNFLRSNESFQRVTLLVLLPESFCVHILAFFTRCELKLNSLQSF